MVKPQHPFSRGNYFFYCNYCEYEETRNVMNPVPERDRVCPKCHQRMYVVLVDAARYRE